jgi:aspartate racemase
VQGAASESSLREMLRIIESLKDRGAQGVILGCTEVGLLIHPQDLSLPVFDTALIHAHRAVELALEEKNPCAEGKDLAI